MDYALEETFDYKFTSRAFATGIPTVLAGLPVIEIYEDNGTTQITAAEELTVDFDSVVGLNNLRVVATAVNGFGAGKSYTAVLSVGTVGGVSVVGEVVYHWTMERSSAATASALTTVDNEVAALQTDLDTLTAGVTLANGAITDASLAGNMEIVFEEDFATNYNVTRNAWETNVQDFVGTSAADPFNGKVVAASVTGEVGSVAGHTNQTADHTAGIADIPTVAEFQARTPTAAQLAYIVANAATGLPVVFTTSGGATTTAVINTIDGSAGSPTNDQYNGRLLVFTDGTLKGVVTDITDYVGSTTTATITAIPFAPESAHAARLI